MLPYTPVIRALWGHLDQGLMFTAALAEDYPNCDVAGLFITARCDFDHTKTEIFNYLPVVLLSDWLNRDFRAVACHRARKDSLGQLRKAIQSINQSPSVLDTETPAAILGKLFPASLADKKAQQAHERVAGIVEKLELIEIVERSQVSQKNIDKFKVVFSQICRTIVTECVHQKLSGYYFLNQIDPTEPHRGHVVLLREIKHIPRQLAKLIAAGLEQKTYEELGQNNPTYLGKLSFSNSDMSIPTGLVRSPEIEHLMQAFALLFSRIGITDPDPAYIETLHATHIHTQDGGQ